MRALLSTAGHTRDANGKLPCFYRFEQRTSDGSAPNDPNGLQCHYPENSFKTARGEEWPPLDFIYLELFSAVNEDSTVL
jgi:hypothetical protein